MNEFLSNPFYIALTAIIYVVLIIYAAIKISARLRDAVNTQLGKINSLAAVKENFRKYVSMPAVKFLNGLINAESKAGFFLKKSEQIFTEKILPAFTEPVNIASLLIRKAYNLNIQASLTFAIFLVVAFYIILSIF